MTNKRSGLGKGLGALIPSDGPESANEQANISENFIKDIDLSLIIPNRKQPRKEFDQNSIENLAKSIEVHGLIQPIVVQRDGGYYQIIAGERRWRAFKFLDKKRIPAIIKEVDDFTIAQLALIENLQREDLNPIEEAIAYQSLLNEYEITQEKMSELLGKSRSYIANTMRLLKLDDYIQNGIIKNTISNGHGRALLSIDSIKDRLNAYNEIVDKGLSVRQAEKLCKDYGKNDNKIKQNRTQTIEIYEKKSVENELSAIFGTKINILEANGKGKIELSFYDIDDFNRIFEMLKK